MARVYGETARHAELKRLALQWAYAEGLTIGAPEVSFPHRRFRVDAAACRPQRMVPSRPPAPSIVSVLRTAAVFECKQVRGDLVRDNARRDAAARLLRELQARRTELEDRLHLHLPHLAQGESLFPEFNSYRLRDCGHVGHRLLVKKIGTVHRSLVHSTKFDRLAAYKLANLHYLVTDGDLVRPHELPGGWGLLVREGDGLRLLEQPVWQEIAAEEQLIFLQRIACRNAWRAPRDQQSEGTTHFSRLGPTGRTFKL